MHNLIQLAMHVDRQLGPIIKEHGQATYLILFAIVFCETGLVVTPFLPGDSLLFAVGIFCHPEKSQLNLLFTFAVFMLAAFLGDTSNYFIGKFFGHKLFVNENSKVFRRSHLVTTHEFFEKHGKKTIILARFVPIVRTFAPFVAGMGEMPYLRFISFSVFGTSMWVALFLFAGYFIGGIKAVEDHFGLAVMIMVVVTGAPLIWEVYKGTKESAASKATAQESSPL
jgi:membrane-associated protein